MLFEKILHDVDAGATPMEGEKSAVVGPLEGLGVVVDEKAYNV